MLGKTNVPELAGAAETDNLIYGRTNNPYDLARTPGGSSGGEFAMIAAGGSPLGSAPMPEAASASPRIIAAWRPSSRLRVAFPGPDNFHCRWAREIRCFTSV